MKYKQANDVIDVADSLAVELVQKAAANNVAPAILAGAIIMCFVERTISWSPEKAETFLTHIRDVSDHLLTEMGA